jgi:hypothetical protein
MLGGTVPSKTELGIRFSSFFTRFRYVGVTGGIKVLLNFNAD